MNAFSRRCFSNEIELCDPSTIYDRCKTFNSAPGCTCKVTQTAWKVHTSACGFVDADSDGQDDRAPSYVKNGNRRNFETNLFALIALTQLVVPHLRAGGSGRIINIGSVAGRIARPLSSVYDATKHALEAVTDGLRGELKPFGIEVVLIRPGFIRTEFVDAANSASEPVIANAGPYAPYFEGFRGNYRRWLSWAGGPDDIARLVEKALAARRPAPRYAGPAHAKLLLFIKWLLPARAVDWLVRLRKV